jgi:hypothetical protein
MAKSARRAKDDQEAVKELLDWLSSQKGAGVYDAIRSYVRKLLREGRGAQGVLHALNGLQFGARGSFQKLERAMESRGMPRE